MFNESFQNLVEYFSKFPGIGPRQAARFVFYLIRRPKEEVDGFAEALKDLKKNFSLCGECFFIASDNTKCHICQDEKRDHNLICVVEKETDAATIEKTGQFNGVYHILGGLIFSVGYKPSNQIKIKELVQRLTKIRNDNENVEVILALNPTTDGDATSLFVERTIMPLNIKTSRLARGLPKGGDIEYADEETMRHAIENRK